MASTDGATLLLERVDYCENEAGEAAGLFNYAETSHLTVRDTAIIGNHATVVGGGLWSSSADWQHFLNVTISGNRADQYAGGAYFSGGPVALSHGTLAGNQAPDGANLYLSDAAVVTFDQQASSPTQSTVPIARLQHRGSPPIWRRQRRQRRFLCPGGGACP